MDSRLVGLSVLHVPTDILGLVTQAIVLSKYVRRLYLADSRTESSNRATNLESTKSLSEMSTRSTNWLTRTRKL